MALELGSDELSVTIHTQCWFRLLRASRGPGRASLTPGLGDYQGAPASSVTGPQGLSTENSRPPCLPPGPWVSSVSVSFAATMRRRGDPEHGLLIPLSHLGQPVT